MEESGSTMTNVPTTTTQHVSSTSRPHMEQFGSTMNNAFTTTTALLDSVTDMKTIPPTGPSTTLANTTPTISAMPDSIEVPTTSFVMDTNMQATAPASTTVTAPATTLPALNVMNEQAESVPVVVPETPSVPASQTTVVAMHAATTSMPVTTAVNEGANDLIKQTDKTVSLAVPTTTSAPSPALTEATISPAKPMTLDENTIVPHAEIDNVLTMSSNEETTRMASSVDSKVDNSDKQTEPPKSEETKNDPNEGGSGCNSVTTSFVVVSMAVLYVIV